LECQSESEMLPIQGDAVAAFPSGLTFGQLAPKTLKPFSGADGRDFETWFRSFEDAVRMVNPPLPDQLKTNTLVGYLEGEARDLVDDMSEESKNDFDSIVERIRSHFESPHFRSLASQQLCDCRQSQTEGARAFAERLKHIVKKACPKRKIVGRVRGSLKTQPALSHVKAANPATFDEAVIKAITYESLLADAANSMSIFPVPKHLQTLIFDAHHNSALSGGHMGWKKTLAKILRKYYWHSVHSDIRKWCDSCLTCQMRRNPKPNFRERLIPVHSEAVFAKVGLDLCGPLKTTERGNKYILNIVCWFTRKMSSDSHSAHSVTSPEELSPLAVEDRPPLPVSDGSVHEEPMDVVLSNAGDGEETPPPAAAVNAPVSAGGESKQFLTFISYDSDE
uniref:Integrase_H2C2 domain-containing protein n=1 Tax=Heligmosomoides polygyrus TaxID=6339 RepID=A0A183GUL2_HELPZ